MLYQPPISFFFLQVSDPHFNRDIQYPTRALYLATIRNDVAQIRSLIDSGGADINARDIFTLDNFGTALHLSIWCNHINAFEALLSYPNCDVNVLDGGSNGARWGDTPIRLAIRIRRRKMVQRLWESNAHGYKYYESDSEDEDHDANGREVEGAEKKTRSTGTGRSLLGVAAIEGAAEILRDLLAWGSGERTHHEEGGERKCEWTTEERIGALSCASTWWYTDCVRCLLNDYPYTAEALKMAMHGCVRGSEGSVKDRMALLKSDKIKTTLEELLEAYRSGEDDTVAYRLTLNTLMVFVCSSPVKIGALSLLLEKGADPDLVVIDNLGLTCLHRALFRRRDTGRCNEDALMLLLKYGARPNIPNNAGVTVLGIAQREGNSDIAELLRYYGFGLDI